MKKKIKDILTIVVCLGMLGAMFLVFPIGKLYITPFTSPTGDGELFGTGAIDNETIVMQEFYPRMEYLNSISIVIQNMEELKTGTLEVSFYDEKLIELGSTIVSLNQLTNYEYEKIKVSQTFIPGKQYFITIKAYNDGIELLQLCATTLENAAVENGQYWYNGLIENSRLAVHYEYANRALSIGEAIPFWGCILVLGTTLIIVIRHKKKQETVEWEQ